MYQTNYEGIFGDLRLERRGVQLMECLFRKGSRSIQSISGSSAERKAFYRLLQNKKVSEANLIKELSLRCGKASQGKIVLAIQDSSEVNLSRHKNRIDIDSGVGTIDAPQEGQIGFKIHPSLVVNALNCFPLGFAHIRTWNRPKEKHTKFERKYNELTIDKKESIKWIETSQKSKECLKEAQAVVIIQDREGDIFEQIESLPDEKTYLLIRSRVDRKISDGDKLWSALSNATIAGTYTLRIDSDSHSKEPTRDALIEVRFIEAEIMPPKGNKKSKPQMVYAVEAKEINSTSKNPVIWRLVSTLPIKNYDEACMVINWYTWRWVIEEVFRMLKKEGFNIEGSELESGWAIRKLCIMLLDTVVKLLQMHIAYNMPEGENPEASISFKADEQKCLQIINPKLEGKTEQLKNPHKPSELKSAVWVIARLGGWKGYKSQRPPGMTTLWQGLKRFYNIFEGWQLEKDVGTR